MIRAGAIENKGADSNGMAQGVWPDHTWVDVATLSDQLTAPASGT
jgi:hypothetical protein